jgi:hypothetical protein
MSSYAFQLHLGNQWLTVATGSKDYCLGYFQARLAYSPRLAQRVLHRPNQGPSKVTVESPAVEEVHIGQMAGFPSAEQYEAAAAKALAAAQHIRSRSSTLSRSD